MHIFLYGHFNVGKSTVIKNTISKLLTKVGSLSLGGFITYKTKDLVKEHDPYIFMKPACEGVEGIGAVAIAEYGAKSPVCIPGVLDNFGADLLRKSHSCDLICMDELGFLEHDAYVFQQEVLRCLDCGPPILGVLREGNIPWHRKIIEHRDVTIIKVTEENRDNLPEQLSEILARHTMR